MRNSRTREVVMAGLFIALGVMLPIAFHAVGAGGPVFLPMHIPALLVLVKRTNPRIIANH